MSKYDLSILIPARNEIFLTRTIEDIVKNKRGNTEVIAVLDGQWSNPGIPMHPDVTVVFLPESIGQRAATNLACKLSSAKFIMKVDAHCAFDEGFDVKMMELMQDDITMVPVMKNLHAFNWLCSNGHRRDQSPSGVCTECGAPTEMEMIWKPRRSPNSTAYRFDTRLEFQYWGEYKEKQDGDLVETLSLQGSCFMLTRAKYWELDICDESWGSWGGQGAEVALKTWLSGGRVLCNKRTWYAHMFRTQGGDFGFPYPNPAKNQKKAKDSLREVFLNDKWEKAKYPLSWLLEKFGPVPGWDVTKGVLFYTDNEIDEKYAKPVRESIIGGGLPVTSVSLKPLDFGTNIVLPLERGYLTMAKQILAGLEAMKEDVVFFCEHDVLYHTSHFDFVPEKENVYYYNVNVWKVRATDGHALKVDDCRQLSGLCAYRTTLIKHYRERVRRIETDGFTRRMGFEPGTHNRKERVDDLQSEKWSSDFPNIDIRHEKNLTGSRWSKDRFRNQKYTIGWTETTVDKIKGWENLPKMFQKNDPS